MAREVPLQDKGVLQGQGQGTCATLEVSMVCCNFAGIVVLTQRYAWLRVQCKGQLGDRWKERVFLELGEEREMVMVHWQPSGGHVQLGGLLLTSFVT